MVGVQRKQTGFHKGTFGDMQGACGGETVIGRLSECAEIAQLPRDWFWNTWRSDSQRLQAPRNGTLGEPSPFSASQER